MDVAKAAIELRDVRVLHLAFALKAIKRHAGFSTPAEELILKILKDYGWQQLTPDSLEGDLENFRSDIDTVQQAISMFAEQFPELANKSEGHNATH